MFGLDTYIAVTVKRIIEYPPAWYWEGTCNLAFADVEIITEIRRAGQEEVTKNKKKKPRQST